MGVVRCYEPRKNARRPEECKGFVALFPFPVEHLGVVAHSSHAHPDSYVAPCSKCGRLHEYRRAAKPTEAA